VTPKERIAAACSAYGQTAVVHDCIDLLAGRDVDRLEVYGGQHPEAWLAAPVNRYWLRVWGARGLLWAYDAAAEQALLTALSDEAWRVREMAAKVVARHLVGDAMPAVEELRHDPVPRVRAAAARAVERLVAAGA
jgi:HEAT repeat protein